MSNVTYTIEGRADGMWCREHVGANESNLFASREEAEAEIQNLARVLECDVSDLRVVEFAGITVELNTAKGPRVEYGRGDDEAAVEAALPAGYSVDFSSRVVLASGRFRAPLVLSREGGVVSQTLAQAVAIARNASCGDMALAASALLGCPSGGWAETEQAMRTIRDALPLRSNRDYSVREFVAAVYYLDAADRYRSVFVREAEQAREQRIERARLRALAVTPLEIEVRPAPSRRTISVYLDGDGFICTSGGLWDEVTDLVPAEWIEQAREARAGIVRASEAVS